MGHVVVTDIHNYKHIVAVQDYRRYHRISKTQMYYLYFCGNTFTVEHRELVNTLTRMLAAKYRKGN